MVRFCGHGEALPYYVGHVGSSAHKGVVLNAPGEIVVSAVRQGVSGESAIYGLPLRLVK